jgi:uncharacterized FAD-dependent dehydrogenase
MSFDAYKPTATWRVLGIELGVHEPEALVRERACRAIGVDPARLRGFRLVKKALDARKRGGVRKLTFVVHADLVVDASYTSVVLRRALESGRVVEAPERARLAAQSVHASLLRPARARVAVVGAGPGGLLAALVLARHELDVVVIDRGSAVEARSKELVAFHRTRTPNPESNLLFGEGGAGTYSDGKIYTRVDDPLEVPILEELVACGAGADIVYDSRAHIGTDRLHRILPVFPRASCRRRRALRVEHARRRASCTRTVACARSRRARERSRATRSCSRPVTARATRGRDCTSKASRSKQNRSARPAHRAPAGDHRRGALRSRKRSGAARRGELRAREPRRRRRLRELFVLHVSRRTHRRERQRARLLVHERHEQRRAQLALGERGARRDVDARATSAPVRSRASRSSARSKRASSRPAAATTRRPAQRASDFLAGRESTGELRSSYVLGLRAARIDALVPDVLRDALRHALPRFDRAIPGFAGDRGLFVGVESRSSGPVRMPRDALTRRALGFSNLYPVGEGAGFAGGIMSAALDGAHAALALLAFGLE